jgi:hypothetical protein
MESQSTGNAARVALKQTMKDILAESTLFLRSPTSLEILIPKPSTTTDEPVVPLGPFQEAGIWSVIAKAEPKGDASNRKTNSEEPIILTQIAVNLSNANETDLRPAESMLKDMVPGVLASGWFSKPIWYYLVAFATALVAIEWFLYQRRIIT